jgi:hypothetical protein
VHKVLKGQKAILVLKVPKARKVILEHKVLKET